MIKDLIAIIISNNISHFIYDLKKLCEHIYDSDYNIHKGGHRLSKFWSSNDQIRSFEPSANKYKLWIKIRNKRINVLTLKQQIGTKILNNLTNKRCLCFISHLSIIKSMSLSALIWYAGSCMQDSGWGPYSHAADERHTDLL